MGRPPLTVHRMPLEQIQNQRIHLGYDYWNQIRGERLMPSRADFSPMDVPRLLPYIILSEVFYDPLRIRYRLVGTRIAEIEGQELTGMWIDQDALPDDLEDWYEDYRIVTQSKAPLFGRDDLVYPERSHVGYEWALLPLSNDGQTVNMILEVIVFENEPALVNYPLKQRAAEIT